MSLYYRMFINEEGRYNAGRPCNIAPDFIEFEAPSDREVRTICAIWCNLMEEHLDFFKRCQENDIQVSLVAYKGVLNEPYGLRKIYSIGNIPSCKGMYKIISLSDIDY